MRNSKGFTLIELMIVVVVVAILAAIAVPSYTSQVKRTNRTDCQGALMNFALAMERHFARANTYDGAADVDKKPKASVFPSECPIDSGNKLYDLTVESASASSFVLRATPKGSQAGDGFLELTSAGEKRWDRDDSGSISADEKTWDR